MLLLQDLFDFITNSLKDFVQRKENIFGYSPEKRRELGFTVSFPVKQTSVSSGILIRWTKGFAIHDMVCLFSHLFNRIMGNFDLR